MVDNITLGILEELHEDGRKSLREISQNIDVSPSTVSNRFHKLKDQETIQGFQPIINWSNLGYELKIISQIKIEGGKIEEVRDKLMELDFIYETHLVTGDTDIMALSRFKTRKDMNKCIREIQKIEGVEESKTSLILESSSRKHCLERLKKIE